MTGKAQLPPKTPLIALDLVRGLAALLVLVVHARGYNWVEFGALPANEKTIFAALFFAVTRLGDEAVMVFFVLSGFLVGGRIIHGVRGGDFDLLAYGVDRSTRIFLPLIPACLFTALIAAVVLREPLGVTTLFGNMLGLNNVLVPTLRFNAPLWSLADEIWFYVVAGALAYWLCRRRSWVAACVIGCATLCFAQLGAAFLLYWMFGALMSVALDVPRRGLWALSGAVLAAIGAGLYQVSETSRSFSSAISVPLPVAQGVICVGFALVLPFLCEAKTNDRVAMLRLPASHLSAFSYSLYLTHYPTICALDAVLKKHPSLDLRSWTDFAVRIVCSVAVAVGFYLAFERHTQSVRRRIHRWIDRPRMSKETELAATRAGGVGAAE